MPNEGSIVGGDYTVQAGGNINLQAFGDYMLFNAISTDGVKGGQVAINADALASISSGPGSIVIAQESEGVTNIGLQASETGSILHVTGVPATPSQIALEPEKITIATGPPEVGQQMVMETGKVTLSVGPPGVGSSIELAVDGITLQFAEWSLAIKATGITLSVGPSSVTVAPEQVALSGLTLDLEGTVQAMLKGVQTQINGSAMVQVEGALTTLG